MQEAPLRPWYRTPFVWLLIGLPATAVIASFITLYLAITTRDGLVVDDYYEQGKAINRELARDHEASRLGLTGMLAINPSSNSVDFEMQTANGVEPPSDLQIAFMHATRDGNDRVLTATRDSVWHYRAPLPEFVPGRYRVQVETPSWRLVGSLHVPGETRIALKPVQ
jgi:hypothetical protein